MTEHRPETLVVQPEPEPQPTAREASTVLDAAPAMIWRTDRNGRCTYLNRAWLEFTGRPIEEELGWGWIEGVHPDDRERCRRVGEPAWQERREVETAFRLQRYDGEYRWLADRGSPTYSADGTFEGYVGLCTDVTSRKLLAARLEEASERLEVLVEALPEAVVLKDAGGRWQLANAAARMLLGLGDADWRGRTDKELSALFLHSREGFLSLAAGDEEAWAKGVRYDSVDLIPDPSGLPRYLEVSRVPLYTQGQERRGIVMLGRNATEHRLAEGALRLAASVFEHNPEGIMITDVRQRILRVNRAFLQITGYEPEEVLGRSPKVLSSGRHDETFYAGMWDSIARSGRWAGEIWNRRRSGEVYPEWLSIVAVTDSEGRISNYVGTFSDIAEKKQVEEEVRRLAYRDPLTGLGNRRLLEESLDLAATHGRALSRAGALLIIDIDRFGAVNDAVGFPAGDAVIRAVGERIAQVVGEAGIVARSYGDEFAVLLQDPTVPAPGLAAYAARLGAGIQAALARPFATDGGEVCVTAAQGVALFPQDADSGNSLLRCAESALRDAKRQGRGVMRFCSPRVDAQARERYLLEQDLRRAQARGELSLHYQPQIDSATGAVTGAEALLRWQHPERGWIGPKDFVPLAEETGLILELGEFALQRCCAQVARWQEAGLHLRRAAVNVSSRQLLEPGFVDRVARILEASGVEATALDLEITESVVIEHRDDAVRALTALRRTGIRISLDDFGTGYSSLNYLKRLPIDVLKIDRSFVVGIPDDPNDIAIALAICTMARSLGLTVIAEGVETPEQAKFLRAIGASELQGHFASPAVDAEAFAEFARRRADPMFGSQR